MKTKYFKLSPISVKPANGDPFIMIFQSGGSAIFNLDTETLFNNSEPTETKALYSFRWISGGFNQVWANTSAEAMTNAREEFPDIASQIDPKSFKRLDTKEEQDAYWKSLPLMD